LEEGSVPAGEAAEPPGAASAAVVAAAVKAAIKARIAAS
jgi:hypothetical protein